MPLIDKNSFVGGEIAPELYARTDLARYQSGAATVRNMFIRPHGGADNRPGLEYVGEIKVDDEVVLIPFAFNTEQTYIIEAGPLYMRFWSNGGPIETAPSTPFELVTPYTADEVFDLYYTQDADVLTIVHPAHAPAELTRLTATTFSLTTITFAPDTLPATSVVVTPVTGGSTTFDYAVTALNRDTLEESLQALGSTATSAAAGWKNDITWTASADADKYVVYRAKNGIYGFVGEAEGLTFQDDNTAPDLTQAPPGERNPFDGAGNFPSAVTYHQQRIGYGGTDNKPNGVWFSQTGHFHNFNVASPAKATDAVTAGIVASQVNRVTAFMAQNDVLIGTTGGEFVLSGNGDAAITPSDLRVRPQGYRGVKNLIPQAIGNTYIYLQPGDIVRDISFDWQSNSFTGQDLTIMATHLFEGFNIVDWGYAQAPNSLLWAVRDDGTMLSLTFMKEHDVWAWTHHDTADGNGTFESVAIVLESEVNALYAIVRRRIGGVYKRYIERLHDRIDADIKQSFFVDSGLSYDVPQDIVGATQADPVVLEVTGHGYANGAEIYISKLVDQPGDVVNMTEINERSFTIANVTTDTFELVNEDGTTYNAYDFGGEVREMLDTFLGLSHLEGQTVIALADGSVEEDLIVSSGSVTLANKAAIVHIGLPMTCDLVTLPTEYNSPLTPAGTTKGKDTVVAKVFVKVRNSRGFLASTLGFSDDMVETPIRSDEDYDAPTLPRTGTVSLDIPTEYNIATQVYIRQTAPVPLSVLAVVSDEQEY